MTRDLSNVELVAAVRALVNLSAVDLLYADQYLCRAEAVLPSVCTREQYRALHQDGIGLPQLTGELREATEQSDWSKVRTLAQRAAEIRERLATNAEIVPLAEAVYGPRSIHADATTLALSGVVAQPESSVSRARDVVIGELRTLATHDPQWASFYQSRIAHFERCKIVSSEDPRPMVDLMRLQQQILAAISAGDFGRVKRLADTVPSERGTPTARLCAPRRVNHVHDLAAAFGQSTIDTARTLGLAVETLEAVSDLNDYLNCCCVERATLPEKPLSEARVSGENCTCGHACPPAVRASLRKNLDLLIGHPFISSAGSRYLPWFGPETLLVESFPEDDPDARSGLLSALGLAKRHRLARLSIEDALLTNGPRVCADIGLDPLQFAVACVPFDAYVRLAPRRGWGQQEFWTHLDGYQVTRELRLWALVGGNAHYGGPDDLSSLVRNYDSERLTARFVILRRERFLVREGNGGAQ